MNTPKIEYSGLCKTCRDRKTCKCEYRYPYCYVEDKTHDRHIVGGVRS